MRFLCVGLNHKTAPLELREQLSFSPKQIACALGILCKKWPETEFMILSTCNRTEIYAARPLHSAPRLEELRCWLQHHKKIDNMPSGKIFYDFEDLAVVEHILGVAAGMDSMVPGEDQIVAQIKDARRLATDAGALGGCLGGLVDEALRTAKRIKQETGISEGRTSVASVAVDCIRHIFGSMDNKVVLSVGGGKMSRLMLDHVTHLNPAGIEVINRSPEKARDLAEKFGGRALPFSELPEAAGGVDVIITSTGSQRPVITSEMIEKAQRQRKYRPFLIVDIAVPRDVEPEAADIDGVFLYNIDHLQSVVDASLDSRREFIQRGELIVSEHAGMYITNLSTRDVNPVIESLYRRVELIIENELAEASNKLADHDDTEEDMEILARAMRRALRKFCHPAVTHIKNPDDTLPVTRRAEMLRRLFDL